VHRVDFRRGGNPKYFRARDRGPVKGHIFFGGAGGGAPQPSCNPTIDMYAFSALFFEKGEKQPLGTDKNTS
jgi:hypothetical protein